MTHIISTRFIISFRDVLSNSRETNYPFMRRFSAQIDAQCRSISSYDTQLYARDDGGVNEGRFAL